ncbi:hypothetical protein BGX30_008593, partial [Mortierella sp. GBA39]
MSASPPAPSAPQTTPPHATFRIGKRRQTHTPKDSRKHLTSDVVKSFYTGACNDRIRDNVNEKVTGMWLKRREQDTPSEVFTDVKKRKIMDGMLKGRVPAGLNDTAVERVKVGCNDTATFKKCNLTTIVDTKARQSLYSESVKSVFESSWDAAILQYQPQANIADAVNHGDPGSSTATMDEGLTEEADDGMDEFPQMDEEELG